MGRLYCDFAIYVFVVQNTHCRGKTKPNQQVHEQHSNPFWIASLYIPFPCKENYIARQMWRLWQQILFSTISIGENRPPYRLGWILNIRRIVGMYSQGAGVMVDEKLQRENFKSGEFWLNWITGFLPKAGQGYQIPRVRSEEFWILITCGGGSAIRLGIWGYCC